MSYDSEVLADSPSLYYKFTSASGHFTDEVNSVVTEKVQQLTYQVTGPITSESPNYGVQFDNNTDFSSELDIPDAGGYADLGDVFTIEFWLKRASTGIDSLIDKGATGGTGYNLWIDGSGQIRLTKGLAGGSDIMNSGATNLTDTASWHHIVATKNGSTRAIYLDGVDVSGSGTNATLTDTSNRLSLGTFNDHTNPQQGQFARLALYKSALSSTRVTAHYDAATAAAGFTGTAASAFGWADSATGSEGFTGTAASAFGWTDAATGAEGLSGVAASAFGWADAATGAEGFTGTAASAFGWTDAATGAEGFTGTAASAFGFTPAASGVVAANVGSAASAFGWAEAATGALAFSGTAASAFGFTPAASGSEGFSGAAASAFDWATAGTGGELNTGTAASAFGWTPAASAAEAFSGSAASAFDWAPVVAAALGFSGAAASAFGWATVGIGGGVIAGVAASAFDWAPAATGDMTLTISGVATVAFGFRTAGTGTAFDATVTYAGDGLGDFVKPRMRYGWYGRGLISRQ